MMPSLRLFLGPRESNLKRVFYALNFVLISPFEKLGYPIVVRVAE